MKALNFKTVLMSSFMALQGMALQGVALHGSLAMADSVAKVTYDENQLPRCVETTDKKSGALLVWKTKERYEREVRAIALKDLQADSNSISCDNWKSALSAANGNKGQLVEANATSINGLQLPLEAVTALAQVRAGAVRFHSELTPAQYLKQHPISKFTLETNQELTQNFGVGFTAQVYKAFLLSNPANRAFTADVTRNAALVKEEQGPIFNSKFQNRTVVFVRGLGHDAVSSKRYDFLPDLLKSLGVSVEIIETASYGLVDANAALIRDGLDKILSRGSDVVVMSLSKGTIESLVALSDLKAKLEGSERPANYGHVRAFVTMSGIYGPSFLMNFATSPIVSIMTKRMLTKDYHDHDQVAPKVIPGMKELTTKKMSAIYELIGQKGVPQQTNYISLVSIIPGNGLSSDTGIEPIQNKITRPHLSAGANDGYVEYPGTQFPSDLAPKNFVVPVDASHVFIDGHFMTNDLSKPDDRRAVIGALLNEIDGLLLHEDGISRK